MPATNQKDQFPGKTRVINKDNGKNQNSSNIPKISATKISGTYKGIVEKFATYFVTYAKTLISSTTVNLDRSSFKWQLFLSYGYYKRINHSVSKGILCFYRSHNYRTK